MKNLFLLIVFMAASQWASAQMTTWTWDTYKVKYSAPSNFKVSKNSAAGFSAGNTNINLTIYPEKGANISYDDMLNSLTAWADAQSLGYDAGAEYIELNGYWGCYIDGVASNGNPTSVLLLIDPDYPEIGLYVWLQYQDGYLDTAVEMLRSFTPN
jgi:hypothetical protein